jgi:hypothetical protein
MGHWDGVGIGKMCGAEKNMKKAISYRLFRLGSIPKKLRPVLAQEEIIVIDEGIKGLFLTNHVNGVGKRYRNRKEGFSGFLAVTKERVVCYTYAKRQINISVSDPRIASMYVDTPTEQRLCLSFESSLFQQGWQGIIQFIFNTEKAVAFRDALLAIGAQKGTAADAIKAQH